MRVLLIGNYDSKQKSMQRFTELLRKSLDDQGIDVRVVKPVHIFGLLPLRKASLKKWIGYVDEFILYPLLLKRQSKWADVVHIVDHCNSVYVDVIKKPVIITCHDLVAVRKANGDFPGQKISFTGRILQNWTLRSLKKFRRICCVSENTKADVLRLTEMDTAQVPVVENAINYPFTPLPEKNTAERLNNLNVFSAKPYILHVGGNAWYKNRIGVVKIFSEFLKLPGFSQYQLILAGEQWDAPLRQTVSALNLNDKILERIDVSNEDLRALYTAAEALLFPSLYEGFGWPVIEAQSCGCPVVCSRNSSLPEIAADAAALIDPDDICSAAKTLAATVQAPAVWTQKGFENAQRFTPQKMAQKYIAEYHAILKEFSRE